MCVVHSQTFQFFIFYFICAIVHLFQLHSIISNCVHFYSLSVRICRRPNQLHNDSMFFLYFWPNGGFFQLIPFFFHLMLWNRWLHGVIFIQNMYMMPKKQIISWARIMYKHVNIAIFHVKASRTFYFMIIFFFFFFLMQLASIVYSY